MKLLITGGAGYIGSVMSAYFLKAGHDVVVVDNLERGYKEAIPQGCKFIEADINDLRGCVRKNDKIDGVIHLAAYASVGESVEQPQLYWQNNVEGTLKLLDVIKNLGIPKLVFASSCATYGTPDDKVITENTRTAPVNAYGMTKLAIDLALASYASAYDFSATSLRFFNVAGAYENFGERHDPESHIIPRAFAVAAGNEPYFSLFGSDYDTTDGSCIRDYIHVLDLADAALLALSNMKPKQHKVYNLANGGGFSNKQVIAAVEKETGKKLAVRIKPRRPGDPSRLVGSSRKIKDELGWTPKRPELAGMIESAWQFYRQSSHD